MENLELLINQVGKRVALEIAQDFLSQLNENEIAELTIQYNRMIGDN